MSTSFLLYGKEVEHPKPGEVPFTEDEGALSRRSTWCQPDRVKPTAETRNLLVIVKGEQGMTCDAVEATMEERVSLVKGYCGGEVSDPCWTATIPGPRWNDPALSGQPQAQRNCLL